GDGAALHRLRAARHRRSQRGHHRAVPRERPPARTAALSGPLVRSAGADAARDGAALGRPRDHRRSDRAAPARQRLLDPEHGEPQPHLQTRTADDGKGREHVLAAGPDRSADDAQSRHHRHARQAGDLREDRPAAVGRRCAAAAALGRRAASGEEVAVMHEVNVLGQPIDFTVAGWKAPPRPPREPMTGRTCRVEPLDPVRHGAQLHAANLLDTAHRNWTYLPYGPFATFDDYSVWLNGVAAGTDPMFHAIVDLATGDAVGVASYLRIDPAAGSIEVGHINYSPRLQRRIAATEAM